MGSVTELWVDREDFRTTKIVTFAAPSLRTGEIRVSIEKFGLTANNVSYALSGDQIGYWKFFPGEKNWGKVPAWSIAEVVESNCENIAVGERLYGLFPMASELVLQPYKIKDDSFTDGTAHRGELPEFYNQYRRTQGESEILQQLEDERCLLFPLFMTSYILFDYLLDNDFFGAEQIVVGSVSSKTGLGLAKLVHESSEKKPKVIGITSQKNVGFVENLNCCGEVVTYGDELTIDPSLTTAYVDMSGNGTLTDALHDHIRDNIVESCMVGATHWETDRRGSDLPGVKPKFFFAPGHIAKRDLEWGPGVLYIKAGEESVKLLEQVKDQIKIERKLGAEVAAQIWTDMLDSNVSPTRGILISLKTKITR